jgi:hypothetical protein
MIVMCSCGMNMTGSVFDHSLRAAQSSTSIAIMNPKSFISLEDIRMIYEVVAEKVMRTRSLVSESLNQLCSIEFLAAKLV